MDAGKVIIGLFMCLILFFVVMTGVYLLIPLQSKMALDEVARTYQAEVLLTEGLSQTQKSSLESDLQKIGLEAIDIQCPREGTLKRGEVNTLSITGTLTTKLPSGFLQFKSEPLAYQFNGRLLGRRISN